MKMAVYKLYTENIENLDAQFKYGKYVITIKIYLVTKTYNFISITII